ncbi:MAG: response regulator transcription factor [Hyphomicrobiaceae bacterium]|nr:response regulator transcription factor [Hyphomicrobiaceae bacterium]
MVRRLTEHELRHLSDAMNGISRSAGEAGAWEALQPLHEIASGGTEILIDVAASRSMGLPVVVAAPAMPGVATNLLTPHQQEVAEHIARGSSNKQIARALGLEVSTVKDHVHAVLTRLGLSSRAQLISSWHKGQ